MDATNQCIKKIEDYYENNSNSVNGSVELKDGSLIPYIIVTIKHPIENTFRNKLLSQDKNFFKLRNIYIKIKKVNMNKNTFVNSLELLQLSLAVLQQQRLL